MRQSVNRFLEVGHKFTFLLLGTVLLFFISVTGCSGERSKPYDRALVTTYAELTLLYEKEKMVDKVADSLYQFKVKDFFVQKGYQQEKFKEVIDELSKHPEAWKMFIQDVTTAMDSLKRTEK